MPLSPKLGVVEPVCQDPRTLAGTVYAGRLLEVKRRTGLAQGSRKAPACSFLLSLINLSLYPRAQIRFLGFFAHVGHVYAF